MVAPNSQHDLSLLRDVHRSRKGPGGLPYIVIEDALPADYYAELERTFPSDILVVEGDAEERERVNRRSARYVISDAQIAPVWRDFFAYHTSIAFLHEVAQVWRDQLSAIHPTFDKTFRKSVAEFSVGLRSGGKKSNQVNAEHDVVLDCQFSINRSAEAENMVRGPHLDSPNKLYAGLFYMRHPDDRADGGDLEFFRLKSGRYPHPKPANIDPGTVEVADRIAYRANTFVLFLNSPLSIHGVTPRAVSPISRRYINLLGECYGNLAEDFFDRPQPTAPLWYRRLRRRIARYT